MTYDVSSSLVLHFLGRGVSSCFFLSVSFALFLLSSFASRPGRSNDVRYIVSFVSDFVMDIPLLLGFFYFVGEKGKRGKCMRRKS